MFRKFIWEFKKFAKITPTILLPFFFIANDKIRKNHNFFFSPYTKNQLENRVSLIQYESNNPIEDRFNCTQIKEVEGYLISVFDGHGGWQVAEFAKNHLAAEFQNRILVNKQKYSDDDQIIINSLRESFDIVEQTIINNVKNSYEMGFGQTSRAGACTLAAFIHNNKLYSANIGDCKGVVLRLENNQYKCLKINHKLNANSKKEQQRLRRDFPNDSDIVVCRKGDNRACYVKNSLQPTRAFGDLRLKYPEFNNPKNYESEYGFPRRIYKFNGPYITHKPDIKVFELAKNDKYLIMGSDGLWDELNKDDIAQIVKENGNDKNKLAENLLHSALVHAAKENKMTLEELKKVQKGSIRRKKHDDITLIVVDISKQT